MKSRCRWPRATSIITAAAQSVRRPVRKRDRQSLYDVLKMCNYTVADTKEAILALNSSSPKVYAVSPVTQDSGALPYAIDEKGRRFDLVDFVQKGIDVLVMTTVSS